MAKRVESFPIDKELVEKFVEINKDLWKKIEHNEKYIYLNFSMVRMQTGWIIPKLIYAKGMEEATGANVVVFTWSENKLLTELIESFGFTHLSFDKLTNNNKELLVKATLSTLKILCINKTGEELKKYTINEISVGKSLYEDIIRTSSLSTIKSTRNKICIKKIVHILWMYFSLEKFIDEHKPLYGIQDDVAYHEGLIIKLLASKGAKISSTNYHESRSIEVNNGNIETVAMYMRKCFKEGISNVADDCILWSENYLSERFKGNNGRSIDRGAFANKKVLTKEEAIDSLKLDAKKKNVVIMAHTFTDGVFNYGDLYFRDYYDWLEKTLHIATKVNNVNWILKPHPTRSAYNESEDSIEKMYDRYKRDNIVMLSDDISAESIANFADVQITIGGNSGGEFTCLGIPTVIVGKTYYQGFGYTIEPKTYDEYEKCLKNLYKVEPLSEEQMNTAKKVFYLRNNKESGIGMHQYRDDFASMIIDEFNKMLEEIALQYFASNKGTKKYNNRILDKIIKYFEINDMRQCDYYIQGKTIALENK